MQNRFFPPKCSNRTLVSARAQVSRWRRAARAGTRLRAAVRLASQVSRPLRTSVRVSTPTHTAKESQKPYLVFPGCIAGGLTRAPFNGCARPYTATWWPEQELHECGDPEKNLLIYWSHMTLGMACVLEHSGLWFIRSHSAAFRRKHCNFTHTLAFK